jgi:hypothetical protein
MFLVGGAAMALGYNTTRSTKDIDGIFEPKTVVYELVAEIAKESDLDLPLDWLNDAVKAFSFPGGTIDVSAKVLYEDDGLSLSIASPRYLLMMKAWSGRESDEEDLRLLWPLCGYASATECLNDIMRSYPIGSIRPRTQYLIEDIAARQTPHSDLHHPTETP